MYSSCLLLWQALFVHVKQLFQWADHFKQVSQMRTVGFEPACGNHKTIAVTTG